MRFHWLTTWPNEEQGRVRITPLKQYSDDEPWGSGLTGCEEIDAGPGAIYAVQHNFYEGQLLTPQQARCPRVPATMFNEPDDIYDSSSWCTTPEPPILEAPRIEQQRECNGDEEQSSWSRSASEVAAPQPFDILSPPASQDVYNFLEDIIAPQFLPVTEPQLDLHPKPASHSSRLNSNISSSPHLITYPSFSPYLSLGLDLSPTPDVPLTWAAFDFTSLPPPQDPLHNDNLPANSPSRPEELAQPMSSHETSRPRDVVFRDHLRLASRSKRESGVLDAVSRCPYPNRRGYTGPYTIRHPLRAEDLKPLKDDTYKKPPARATISEPNVKDDEGGQVPVEQHFGSHLHLHYGEPVDIGLSVPTKSKDLVSRQLQGILVNATLCRVLLRARGSDAQMLLDLFQWLLDDSAIDDHFKRHLIVATQRLSLKTGLYPVCYELNDVIQESADPVAGGGFADVYKGRFRGQIVCLKTIRLYRDSQLEHVLKQFSKEAILWGQLCHTNVLPVYGLYHFKNRICIVAPWMDNGDIVAYLELNPIVDRRFLAFDVAKGLQYLHNNSIIHGDLKGPNILIDEQGRARLCDFGIASVCDPEIKAWTTQSSASSKGGSTRWQAPELFDLTEDDEDVKNTTSSDVYAFGCVCYEFINLDKIFTGKIPFYNILRDATVSHHVKLSKRPSRPEEPGVSWGEWGLTESIWLLMEDCWKANADERPSVEHIIERLLPLLRHDERASGSINVLPPTHFRRSISEPPDAMSMASFDDLCKKILAAEQLASAEP
ncbi:hypothetical protein DXG01_017093 [Tephrocybe rancida]|nr:hypothetical protein DXG01_017093 [Tephrocybe rancida]